MKQHLRSLYETILALPLSCAVLLLLYHRLGLKKFSAPVVLLLLATCILSMLTEYLRGRDRFLVLGVSLILASLPLLYAQLSNAPRFLINHRYLWLVPLLAVLCYVLSILCKHFRPARYVIIIAILTLLVSLRAQNIEIPKASVMLFGTVLLLLLIEETQRRWHKEGDIEHTAHLVGVAPFVLLYLLLALQLPTRTKPFEWTFVKDFIIRIEDLATSISQRLGRGNDSDDFHAYLAGFSGGETKLGGDVTTDETVLLQLEVFPSSITSVYLVGETSDTFQRLSWKRTLQTANGEHDFDMLETRAAILRNPSSMDLLRDFSLRVHYRNLSTRYLFTPERSIVNLEALSALDVTEQGRTLRFAKKHGINTEYAMEGFQLNALHPAFAEYLRNYVPFTEEEWNTTVRRSKRNQLVYSYAALLDYREFVKASYYHEVTLSEPVKAYIDSITEGSLDTYDKLLRLRQALSSFAYTRTPDEFPTTVTDADTFLHYFFATQKGYCSYFATAMVLLAWNEGLPARYVSGFLAPIGNQKLSDVTGTMAHAWCEVYFEGIGWIPFDATPGYGTSTYWATRAEAAAGDKPSVHRPEATPTPTIVPSLSPLPTETPSKINTSFIALLTLIGLLLLLTLTAVVLIADRIYLRKHFARSTDAEKITILYRRNTHLLALLRLPIRDEETLLMYAKRLSETEPELPCEWLTEYEDFLYGSAADTAPELIEAQNKKALPAMQRGNALLLSVFRKRMPKRYALCRLFNRLLR